jgi:hypothetical protein
MTASKLGFEGFTADDLSIGTFPTQADAAAALTASATLLAK